MYQKSITFKQPPIKNLVAKYESTDSVQNVSTPTRVQPGPSNEYIAAVSHRIDEDLNL